MAHGANLISKIKLPNMPDNVPYYEVHDAEALHSGDLGNGTLTLKAGEKTTTFGANQSTAASFEVTAEDLGLSTVLKFKGTKDTAAEITALVGEVGDVWLCKEDASEYVCVAASTWEKLGPTVSLDGYVTKAQHNAHVHSVTVAGTASADSALSASASIAADKVVTGLTTGGIGASVTTGVAVGVDGTVAAVTGFTGDHTTETVITELDSTTVNSASASDVNIDKYSFTSKTASKATAATAIPVPNTTAGTPVEVAKAGTKQSIPNVTSAGTASTWSFAVSGDTLTIGGGNGTAPTLGTAIEVIPAVANGTVAPAVEGAAISIPQYTFADVTSSLATKDATGYVASKVTTSEVTVATATPANTTNAITALSGFDTENAAKGVKVTTQPAIDIVAKTGGYSVVTGGTKGAVANIPVSGTAAAQSFSVTVDTGAPKNQL